ncbi:MAG TPA: hypothetical protein VLA52_17025 [Thermohalobaculum sp.]|nr:hypothetical protein [Thermohalobaculum sp.]
MPRTHTFARHQSGEPVDVALDKIEAFEHDAFSYCTTLFLVSGMTIPVDNPPDEVRKIMNDA